jgi:O-antigen/teichoic acid export membrane protein
MSPIEATQAAPETRSRFRRVLRGAGIDRAIGYTVVARVWAAFSGLVTVALIARFLSPAEQGYYFTFGSLVALQIVFELGFSVVILQLSAHETAHLAISAAGEISGSAGAHARLASVLQKSVKWYGVASAGMACVLIPVGWRFFSSSAGGKLPIAWELPWVAVVLASSITFQIDPIFSFLEGCGMVSRVARTRLAQSMAGSLLAWSALLLHRGLFAPACLIGGQAVAGLIWLFQRRRLLLGLLRHAAGELGIDWWREVWPFQWRIAISFVCGFFIFQLFNPVLFRYWGPAAAGRMGMSISIANALASVAIAWVTTKAAPFGTMIARREFAELDTVFFRSARQAVALCLGGALCVWLGCLVLAERHVAFAQRVLPPLPFAFLLMSVVLNQVVASMALYLRAHKQEKFLVNSVVGAVCVALSTYFLGRRFGAVGMTAGQFAITAVVGVGYGSYIFLRYRRLWHA